MILNETAIDVRSAATSVSFAGLLRNVVGVAIRADDPTVF